MSWWHLDNMYRLWIWTKWVWPQIKINNGIISRPLSKSGDPHPAAARTPALHHPLTPSCLLHSGRISLTLLLCVLQPPQYPPPHWLHSLLFHVFALHHTTKQHHRQLMDAGQIGEVKGVHPGRAQRGTGVDQHTPRGTISHWEADGWSAPDLLPPVAN